MTEPDTVLGVADCHELRDYTGAHAWLWWAAINDTAVQFLTTDADLVAYVRPVLTDSVAGLELVDSSGKTLASSYRYIGTPVGTPVSGEPVVDPDDLLEQIRALSEENDTPLAALVRQLDEHLTADRGLPDPWYHPDIYDD